MIGVNFGRVGFLASIPPDALEEGLARVFAGEYVVLEQPTLEARLDGETFVAVNDVVATSSTLGRMVELAWAVGDEDLGTVPCDGMICSTPSGSTAYNLSNGGPVLVRGLEAMAVTFIAPHSLHARPLVVPRGAEVTVRNATPDVGAAVLVDGHRAAELPPEARLAIRLGEQRSLLATLPETTFFGALPRDLHLGLALAGGSATRPPARVRTRWPCRGPDPGPSGPARRPRRKRRWAASDRRTTIARMLRRLRIENLVLIREAELELAPGLNAITGETGAGKTILAQAVGLLLGAKGDDAFVGPAAEEAYVEAELDLPDELEELGRPAPRGRGRPARLPPRLRRRPHARLRVGTRRRARGRRRRGRAAARDVRPVRAAAACAALVPARGARPLLRRGAAAAPGRGARRVAASSPRHAAATMS